MLKKPREPAWKRAGPARLSKLSGEDFSVLVVKRGYRRLVRGRERVVH